ncbi:hypothetical protein ABZW18_30075 [Streptomyces sp. NPDC004647]|uniref:hypothetical protein n=1 Tax=Streptomyces sp. NPDC004647 TaxID=3154671 RepID=UPI0033BB5D0B
MQILTLGPVGYVVVAEVVHGPAAAPILGDGVFCSVECATQEVRDLAVELGIRERGVSFLAHHKGRPVGLVVARRGQMWAVQILSSHELASND